MLQFLKFDAKMTKIKFICFEINMITLNPNAKFSYNLVRGSNQARREFVSRMNEKFFDAFVSRVNKQGIRLQDIRDIYKQILPECKSIELKKLNSQNYCGASGYTYDSNNQVTGVTLEVPVRCSRIHVEDFITLMHENTHVLATLANPKHTILTQKMHKDGKYTVNYDRWYGGVLYAKEELSDSYKTDSLRKMVKSASLMFLSGKPLSDKIHYVQDARYELEQEQLAYEEEVKYARKLKELGFEVAEEDLQNSDAEYFFSEKIEVLKELLAEYIQKARKNIAERNERKRCRASYYA